MSLLMDETSVDRYVSLAAGIRQLVITKVFSVLWSDAEDGRTEYQAFKMHMSGLGLILEQLGIGPSVKPFLTVPARDSVLTHPLDSLLEDPILQEVGSLHGPRADFLYFSLSEAIASVYYITSWSSCSTSPEGSLRESIADELRSASQRFRELGEFLSDEYLSVAADACHPAVTEQLRDLAAALAKVQPTIKSHASAHARAVPLMRKVIPSLSGLAMDLMRAEGLLDALAECPAGAEHASNYENLCIRILWFLFVPPCRSVYVEARSTSSGERRDAIIPNPSGYGLWATLRHEFGTRHIICEFKNGAGSASKEALNQLRLYLDKSSIGRFGLLFLRNGPSRSLIAAQKSAFADRNMFVLVCPDYFVERMVFARVYLREVAPVLEEAKARFEMTF